MLQYRVAYTVVRVNRGLTAGSKSAGWVLRVSGRPSLIRLNELNGQTLTCKLEALDILIKQCRQSGQCVLNGLNGMHG